MTSVFKDFKTISLLFLSKFLGDSVRKRPCQLLTFSLEKEQSLLAIIKFTMQRYDYVRILNFDDQVPVNVIVTLINGTP